MIDIHHFNTWFLKKYFLKYGPNIFDITLELMAEVNQFLITGYEKKLYVLHVLHTIGRPAMLAKIYPENMNDYLQLRSRYEESIYLIPSFIDIIIGIEKGDIKINNFDFCKMFKNTFKFNCLTGFKDDLKKIYHKVKYV